MEPETPPPTRDDMLLSQLQGRGISDARVLRAMEQVPREAFVPEELRTYAFADAPLAIGEGQTISQPYVVAWMVEALELTPGDSVLEVGAGSGYASAVLSRLCREVHAIERHATLANTAAEKLRTLGYANVQVHTGDGTLGLPQYAPFDAILVSAGGPEVPPALMQQLAPGGRLVIPVGPTQGEQELLRIRKSHGGHISQERLGAVRFVPLIGEHGWGQG